MIGELAALGAAITWAIAPLLYRKALTNAKPISANITRLATNAAVLILILVGVGLVGVLAALPPWILAVVIVSGVLGLGVGDTLYMFGLKSIGVSKAVPLAASYPLFSLVWAVLLLGQPLLLTAVAGAIVILVGIWLLSSQKIPQEPTVKGRAAWVGVAMCLSTAVVWSIGITMMDVAITSSAVTGLGANYAIVTVRIVSMALILLVLAPFIDKDRGFLKISRRGVILLCIGGLIANGLGWLLMNYSFQYLPEATAVPISSTSPLFATFAGFLFFQEKATVKTIAGAAAIVAGILLLFIV
ncbi:MAG: DMT family transporter [Candidatus Bathyarchaeia archaeon]|jgi:drug/metabolite transporter (DMT)-like permease